MMENRQRRVCVVGAGKRFLSGISYYTLHLANVLAQTHEVSVILMRQLLPRVFYPGRKRVGVNLTQLEYDPAVRVFDGVDWYWLPSILRSLAFLVREHPDVVVLQWWSGTVLHSYLMLALAARLLGSQVVIEFHEVLDTGEAKLPLARVYVRMLAPLLVRLANGFVIHSEYDRAMLRNHYNLKNLPMALIPHGPYNHCQVTGSPTTDRRSGTRATARTGKDTPTLHEKPQGSGTRATTRVAPTLHDEPPEAGTRATARAGKDAPTLHDEQQGSGARATARVAPTLHEVPQGETSCCNLLFFGVIRPFKGLEDLIKAFDALPENEISKYWLTIVGETWEGWTLPADLIERSRYRARITFVNRYVSDAEVTQFFAEADAVVLPYHRSSASGPLHMAMSCGLPVVVTSVGGLTEAVADYDGTILVPPGDTIQLQRALLQVANLCGRRYTDPHSWERTTARYQALFDMLGCFDNVGGEPEGTRATTRVAPTLAEQAGSLKVRGRPQGSPLH